MREEPRTAETVKHIHRAINSHQCRTDAFLNFLKIYQLISRFITRRWSICGGGGIKSGSKKCHRCLLAKFGISIKRIERRGIGWVKCNRFWRWRCATRYTDRDSVVKICTHGNYRLICIIKLSIEQCCISQHDAVVACFKGLASRAVKNVCLGNFSTVKFWNASYTARNWL